MQNLNITLHVCVLHRVCVTYFMPYPFQYTFWGYDTKGITHTFDHTVKCKYTKTQHTQTKSHNSPYAVRLNKVGVSL